MRRVLKWLAMAALVGAALALAAGLVVDRFASQDVVMVVPDAKEVVSLRKATWAPGDPVAELYGLPVSEPIRVVMPDSERLVRPEEDPGLLLLMLDKSSGDNPLQVKTVWFAARWVAVAGGIVSALSVLAFLLLRSRPGRGN